MHHFEEFTFFNLSLFGIDLSITTTVTIIWAVTILVLLLFLFAARRPNLIPGHLQGTLEAVLEFLEETAKNILGENEKHWLPFLIALFFFILFCNLAGLIPGLSSPTSEINVTATLAIMVFLTAQIYNLARNGPLKYLKHFVPEGIPKTLIPLFIIIEFFTQLAKPFSLAVRLFANLFAGHTALMVIIGIILILKNKLFYSLPIAGYILVASFEIFIAFIQAFIFTFLTAFYLSEALLAKDT